MDTPQKVVPSNPTTMMTLPHTTNMLPSVIVEENASVVENEYSLVEPEKVPKVVPK